MQRPFFFLLWILLLAGEPVRANMASPLLEGSRTASALSSKDVDVLSEKISITLDSTAATARFVVEYVLRSAHSGRQVPLLFYAQDYKEDFRVWLDGMPVAVAPVPVGRLRKDAFNGLGDHPPVGETSEEEITIYWEENAGTRYRLSDLHYFETPLDSGVHTVRVAYTAAASVRFSDWVQQYSFRYVLAPAKYWKSFRNLEVELRQEGPLKNIQTTLGPPREGAIGRSATWTFETLPADDFQLSFQPPVSHWARTLIMISPLGLALLALLLLGSLHLLWVRRYRRRHPPKKYSPPVILGSWIVPLLALIVFIGSFGWIDNVIGEVAGRRHGYVFFYLVFYPVLMPFYWLWVRAIDQRWKRRFNA